jgi:hypothetical protein
MQMLLHPHSLHRDFRRPWMKMLLPPHCLQCYLAFDDNATTPAPGRRFQRAFSFPYVSVQLKSLTARDLNVTSFCFYYVTQ